MTERDSDVDGDPVDDDRVAPDDAADVDGVAADDDIARAAIDDTADVDGVAADDDTADVDHDRHRLSALSEPAWRVIESVVEYDTGWYTGGYDLVEQPDGSTKRYYWAALAPAAVVVAIDDDHLLFVEQYRPTIRETQYELPAGIVEPGESFEVAAARELQEETGFAPGSVELLDDFWCSTGVLRHRRGIVVATDLTPAERTLDSNEFLEPRAVPLAEALSVARASPTNDATLEGVLLAKNAGLL